MTKFTKIITTAFLTSSALTLAVSASNTSLFGDDRMGAPRATVEYPTNAHAFVSTEGFTAATKTKTSIDFGNQDGFDFAVDTSEPTLVEQSVVTVMTPEKLNDLLARQLPVRNSKALDIIQSRKGAVVEGTKNELTTLRVNLEALETAFKKVDGVKVRSYGMKYDQADDVYNRALLNVLVAANLMEEPVEAPAAPAPENKSADATAEVTVTETDVATAAPEAPVAPEAPAAPAVEEATGPKAPYGMANSPVYKVDSKRAELLNEIRTFKGFKAHTWKKTDKQTDQVAHYLEVGVTKPVKTYADLAAAQDLLARAGATKLAHFKTLATPVALTDMEKLGAAPEIMKARAAALTAQLKSLNDALEIADTKREQRDLNKKIVETTKALKNVSYGDNTQKLNSKFVDLSEDVGAQIVKSKKDLPKMWALLDAIEKGTAKFAPKEAPKVEAASTAPTVDASTAEKKSEETK